MTNPEAQAQAPQELLPCPFCLGPAFLTSVIGGDSGDGYVWHIGCAEDNDCPMMPSKYAESESTAIHWWNIRADAPRATPDDRDKFLTHFTVKVEPFYEKKHGKVPPTVGALWELLMFVQHELERRATGEATLTVEACLVELREMFPGGPAEIQIRTDSVYTIWFWPSKQACIRLYEVGQTLDEAMQRCRAWAKSRDGEGEKL